MNPAAQIVRDSLGLNNDPTSWSYEERIIYNKALADYILSNPSQYTPAELTVATTVRNASPSPLDDTSGLGQLSDLGGALVDEGRNALESISGVGQGILSTFSLAKWLIPLAAIAAVVILLFALKKKVAA